MEPEYRQLVGSGGAAEPLRVERFEGALCVATAFWPRRNRRPSAKALGILMND